MLIRNIKKTAPHLKNLNKLQFSTANIQRHWSIKDWFISDEQRRKEGITPTTIFEQFKNENPNKLVRRLLYVEPKAEEAKIYEDAAIKVLSCGKTTKGFRLWDVAAKFNYHTINGLNTLGCRSLLAGSIGFERAIWAFEKITNDYHKISEHLTPEIQKKLGAIHNNLAITHLMNAFRSSSKINEKLFEKNKTQAILYFEEAAKCIPNNEVILLNLEVAKLMNYRVHVSFPETKLVIKLEEPTPIFSVIKNNLLDNASATESHTDLAPVVSFGNNGSFGMAATTSYSTKIYADNMHIAAEMEKVKRKVEKRIKNETPENLSLPRLTR